MCEQICLPDSAAQLLESVQLLHECTRVELIRLREALLIDMATNKRGYARMPTEPAA